MKILYLTPGCFDKGGISRYNRYQISALREIFGESGVRVLSLIGPKEGDFEDNFTVHWHGTSLGGIQKLRFVQKAVREVITWKPDLILVAHVNLSGLAVGLSFLGRSKTVLNVYGLEVWSGLSFDAAFGLRRINQVISDCYYTAKYIEQEGFRPEASTIVIWDCVDLEKFRPQPARWGQVQKKYSLPNREGHFIILTLGRLAFEAAHKGFDRLIKVFAQLHTKHPEARLIIAGKGNMVNDLKKQVQYHNVTEFVTFTGMVHEDDMAALYSYAHVFSLVSDRGKGRGEGIPLTPLEAMACKVPIIVGNQDGSQEAIFDNRNGTAIDPFDFEAHTLFFRKLIQQPRLRKEQAQEAEVIAREVFSYQIFMEKHKQLKQLV